MNGTLLRMAREADEAGLCPVPSLIWVLCGEGLSPSSPVEPLTSPLSVSLCAH